MTLAERLQARRVELGYSLADAHHKSGVARSYLYQLERGVSQPTVDKLQAIARAYNTTVAYLIGEADRDVVRERLAEALAHAQRLVATLEAQQAESEQP